MKFGPKNKEEAAVFALEELRADLQYEILKRMKEAGVSQAALARQLGVSAAWVSQILGDDANLTLESISRIFLALGSQCQFSVHPVGEHYYHAVWSDEWTDDWSEMEIKFDRREAVDLDLEALQEILRETDSICIKQGRVDLPFDARQIVCAA